MVSNSCNVLLLGLIIFGKSLAARAEVIIATGPSAYSTVFSKLLPTFEKETGIKLSILGDPMKLSSLETYNAVISGKATCGVASQPFDAWVKSVKDRQGDAGDSASLTHRLIGHDKVKAAAHKEVGVERLTMAHLSDVFTGKIKNWKEVGGSDVPVTVVVIKKNKPTTDFFRKKAMNDAPFGGTIKEVESLSDGLKLVAETKGAVTVGTAEALEEKLKIISHPDIGRPMTMITKGIPNEETLKLIKYINENRRKFDID